MIPLVRYTHQNSNPFLYLFKVIVMRSMMPSKLLFYSIVIVRSRDKIIIAGTILITFTSCKPGHACMMVDYVLFCFFCDSSHNRIK